MTPDEQRLRSGVVAGLTAYLVWGALTLYWKLLTDFDAFDRLVAISQTPVEEAAFRDRLRGWLTEQKGKFPTSGDAYWAKAGDWHRALYAAGFFGTSWPKQYGGQGLPPVYDVIVDEEIAKAGAPARPSLGYLVVGFSAHAGEEIRERFLPGMINGSERWCQGFSEPGAGSDLASLTTTATRDGDDYIINGHKIWTSYSDCADWCLVLARTDKDVPKHKGISAFIVSMHQPGIVQRPLKMISGVTKEFGQVEFDGARVPAANLVGAPGDGWKLAMTVVSHEREPSTLGFSARYGKLVRQLAARVDGEVHRVRFRELLNGFGLAVRVAWWVAVTVSTLVAANSEFDA